MKSVRVMVVVPLLLFLHNLTPASSNEEVKVQTTQTTPPAKMDQAGSTPSPTASKAVQEPRASTAAPITIQVTTAPQGSTNQPADSNKSELKASTVLATASTATTTDLTVVSTAPAVVPSQDTDNSRNSSFQPRSGQSPNAFPGNYSETTPDKNNVTDVIAETTEKQKTGKGSHQTVSPPSMPQTERGSTAQGAGPQTGTNEEAPQKSDKRLWWIMLPALVVAAAAAMVLRFKCKKVHDHTETIDTGTENASFQSRPESTKDGVMLLGVKSSGGEENAAAR